MQGFPAPAGGKSGGFCRPTKEAYPSSLRSFSAFCRFAGCLRASGNLPSTLHLFRRFRHGCVCKSGQLVHKRFRRGLIHSHGVQEGNILFGKRGKRGLVNAVNTKMQLTRPCAKNYTCYEK